MGAPQTVGEALQDARQALGAVSETPGLDAQLLLSETIGAPRSWVLAHPESPLSPDHLDGFQAVLGRCLAGEALPHVLGRWEFYGRRFLLTPEVLIPRPETEILVDVALQQLADRPRGVRVIDVGTGSGCIAVTLAAETPAIRVIATDTQAAALTLARRNAQLHGVADRVDLVRSDLLSAFGSPFDLVCANLPYIPSEDLGHLVVGRREPVSALDGGADGLRLIRRLVEMLPRLLAPGGQAVLEIGSGQAQAVCALGRDVLPLVEIRLVPDLARHDRVVVVRRQGAST
jgi:release factor glutamine methyltransferase